ncbi:MAG TPA: hypothetical protein VND43_08120 [Burkholderiales bacterium]|nr:hypothetical protein [Burkholderiales bacterium]
MIRNPIDASIYVSPQLSEFIERWVNDMDIEQPITLAQMRNYLLGLLPESFKQTERMHHFDISESILDELDALIEEYGQSALASEFLQTNASEPLSRVIEAVINNENQEIPPTLNTVRDAMLSGLTAQLIGEGVLDEDEDEGLLSEIDALIDRYGADSQAEQFIRYE